MTHPLLSLHSIRRIEVGPVEHGVDISRRSRPLLQLTLIAEDGSSIALTVFAPPDTELEVKVHATARVAP